MTELEYLIDPVLERSELTLAARSLRIAVIQNLYNRDMLSEDDARELLSGPLEPDDDSTIFDDSDQLKSKHD